MPWGFFSPMFTRLGKIPLPIDANRETLNIYISLSGPNEGDRKSQKTSSLEQRDSQQIS